MRSLEGGRWHEVITGWGGGMRSLEGRWHEVIQGGVVA